MMSKEPPTRSVLFIHQSSIIFYEIVHSSDAAAQGTAPPPGQPRRPRPGRAAGGRGRAAVVFRDRRCPVRRPGRRSTVLLRRLLGGRPLDRTPAPERPA